MIPEILFVIFGVMIFLGIFILFRRSRKKLNQETFLMAKGKIQNTQSLEPAHAILESHKIFVTTLQSLIENPKSNSAQIVQNMAFRFPNKKRVWQYHRLRNQIAHETDIKITPQQADEARKEFIRALESLL